MSKFDRNKRDLYHAVKQEVRSLESEYHGLAPINILLVDLEDSYSKNEILNGINDLVNNNVINRTDDKQYLRSCY